MGVYADKQAMIDRFSEDEIRQLTDRARPPVGAINDTVLNRALGDADGQINAALAGRYTLPLASVPSVLQRVACNLARYFLYDDRAGEGVTQRYKDEVAFLKDVQDGKATLGLDASNATVATETGGAEFNESRRVFGDDACGREYG